MTLLELNETRLVEVIELNGEQWNLSDLVNTCMAEDDLEMLEDDMEGYLLYQDDGRIVHPDTIYTKTNKGE